MVSLRKIFLFLLIIIASTASAAHVFAAGNIDSVQKYSQFLNIDLDNNGTNDFINWNPTHGGATVSDTAITGDIWGETAGWINLNPTHAGVANSCSGVLGGYAWGQNVGWVNFAPTHATGADQPKINTTTGKITGAVWSQNYGWIELSSPAAPSADPYDPSLGLVTSWQPSMSCGGGGLINGVCGSSNGGTFSSVPSSGLCNAGTASVPIATSGGWIWQCGGISGGTTASCAASASGNGSGGGGGMKLNVITHVIGGTKTAANFTVHATQQGGGNLPGSPSAGYEAPGQAYTVTGGNAYSISQDAIPGYSMTVSGDCDAGGNVSFPLNSTSSKTCTITDTFTSAQSKIYGCTNPAATNYNSAANVDDGSCKYSKNTLVPGCMNPTATNYNPSATTDDGSCQFGSTTNTTTSTGTGTGTGTGSNGTTTVSGTQTQKLPISTVASAFPPVGNMVHVWWWPFLALLGLLSSIPSLFTRFMNMLLTFVFNRKRQRGIVYDSKTKEPLDPAYLSVIDATTGKELFNQITDLEGRYGFILKKGTYKIVANKTHYQFPSVQLAGRTSDQVYENLYFGEVFTVSDEDYVVTMNIPMDPLEADWNQQEKRRIGALRYFIEHQKTFAWFLDVLFIIGFLVSLAITYYSPVWWNILMSVLYIVIATLQVTGFGAVTAGKITKNGAPLGGAIVRVYNANLNHEVAHKITTETGGYYLLVPKANYYLTIEQQNADGSYTHVFTSTVMSAGQGVINKSFDL